MASEPRWPELPDPPSEGVVILHLAVLIQRRGDMAPDDCDCCRYASLLLRDALAGQIEGGEGSDA
jgi:hypothetical protein